MTIRNKNEYGFAGILVVLAIIAVLIIGGVIYFFSDSDFTDYLEKDKSNSLQKQSEIVPTVSDSDEVDVLEDELDTTDLGLDDLDGDLDDLEGELNSL